MFPAATAAPFARNVVRGGILAIFSLYFLCIQVLIGLAKFAHGLSRYIRDGPWEGKGLSPGGSKAHYGSLPARHVMMGSLTFCSMSNTFFTLCQGFLRMKRGRRAALDHVCAHGINKKASQAIAIIVSWDFDDTSSWMSKLKKILCLHVSWVHTRSKKKAVAERQSAAVRKKA